MSCDNLLLMVGTLKQFAMLDWWEEYSPALDQSRHFSMNRIEPHLLARVVTRLGEVIVSDRVLTKEH